MRRFIILSAIFVMTSVLYGCAQIAYGREEIDRLFITRIISIDEAAEGKVMLTITTKNISVGSGAQEQIQTGESIVSEGDTLFDAARNLLIYADRRPHYGHTEYILFGESIARRGILPYLDFISRQNEFRYNAKIYIIKGDTANSLVKKANTKKMFVGDRISSIEEDVDNTSLSSIVTLNEALRVLGSKNLQASLPYIELTDTMFKEEGKDTSDILLRGYAVFSKDKLSYFTSKEEARGISWMTNEFDSAIIIIKAKSGEEISMEIIDSNVKLIPEIKGDALHCTADISFTSNIGEIMGKVSIIDYEDIKHVTEQQSKAVKEEVENAIRIAQEKNSDHFNTLSKFILKYPLIRDYFNDNWNKLFPDIKFDIKVKSNIKGTYMLNDPTESTEEIVGE